MGRLIVEAELHCHTIYSDGLSGPDACIRSAAKKGLSVLAITDHNTAEGALPYWQESLQQGILVIPGEEVSTEIGHVLVYFVRQTILPGKFISVINQAHQQGAICFMAHPFHIPLGNGWRKQPVFRLKDEHFPYLAGLEVENGHNRKQANFLAKRLAAEKSIRSISGSDAHHIIEIGNARTELVIKDLSTEGVRQALTDGDLCALPRRFNSYPMYLGIALINRINAQKYSWKEP